MKTTRIITLSLTLLVSCVSFAQENTDDIKPAASMSDASYANKSAIALNLSTTGIGLEYAYNFQPHLNGRVRFNYFSLSDYQRTITLENKPVLITANTDIMNMDLALEYLPFTKSSFKLVAGAAIFFNAKLNVKVNYEGELEYEDIVLSQEEVGDITVDLDQSGFAPYMGLGFGRAVPKNRVGFGIEDGTYYAGSPKVDLSATKMFEPTATEEKEQLEENLSGYQWLPYITLRLAVKI